MFNGIADMLQTEFNRRWLAGRLRMEFKRRGFIVRYAENCGTGAGGFKEGNTCGGEEGGKPERKRPEQLSDMELGFREESRNYDEVMQSPEAASTENLIRANGTISGLISSYWRRIQRGEVTESAGKSMIESLNRESDNITRIIKGRRTGELKGPKHESRARSIARKALEQNKNIHALMREMGLNFQERRELLNEVSSELESLRAEQKPKASDARKAAQQKQIAREGGAVA